MKKLTRCTVPVRKVGAPELSVGFFRTQKWYNVCMTTINALGKTFGAFFFFISLLLIYKLATNSSGSYYELSVRSAPVILATSAFVFFLLSVFLFRYKTMQVDTASQMINIRIVKFIFIFLGIYTLYQLVVILVNPWTLVVFLELNISMQSLVTILYLILLIVKPIIYFSIPYLINKNYKWSIWLGMGSLSPVLYDVYRIIVTFYYLRFHPYDSFSILPSYSVIVFPVIIIILSLFSVIVLYSLRKTFDPVTRN